MRVGRIALGLVVVVVALLATLRIWDSTTDNRLREIEAQNSVRADKESRESQHEGLSQEIRTDSVTECIVEFGEVGYGTTATERLRLRNTTDKPLTLIEYQATCRCTWIELPRYPIAPGEWAEAEVKFDSRGEHGSVGNYIEVSTSDERCIIAVWMSAEVI